MTPREIQTAINQGQEEHIGHLMDHIAFAQDRSQWEQVPPLGTMTQSSGSIAGEYQVPIPSAAAAAQRTSTARGSRDLPLPPGQATMIRQEPPYIGQRLPPQGPPNPPPQGAMRDCGLETREYVCRTQGPNLNRKFLRCHRPIRSQCEYFVWLRDQPHWRSPEDPIREAPMQCRRNRTTRAGSNAFITMVTCRDCGQILQRRQREPGDRPGMGQ